jgi:sodium/hydrogen exchanger-like protein 6/7
MSSIITTTTSHPLTNQDLGETFKRDIHKIDSINLLIFTFLLILVISTIWLFKYKRFPYVHETGLAIFYGAIFGIIIRYGFKSVNRSSVNLLIAPNYNISVKNIPEHIYVILDNQTQEKYIYAYKAPLKGDVSQQDYEEKATFDPEIFFNLLLPPIIFHAGYSMKRVGLIREYFEFIKVFTFSRDIFLKILELY